jgi:ubiquinone/menaquinone biosynthesis C-methylase UbiE
MKNLFSFLNRKNIYSPKDAYNIWADTYDIEENNLMLFYDKIILGELISKVDLKGKVILDHGCGTGRNWPLFQKNEPEQIIGCDISSEMLARLKSKYENAKTYLIDDNRLPFLNNAQCDIIISTLVIAHVKKIKDLFAEWNRITKDSSDIIITDFHPALLSIGGSRTFKHFNKSITIKNFIHEITTIEKLLSSSGFKTVRVIEKKIDEEVKHFYVNRNALSVYDKFKNVPFIYGIHMSRSDVVK